MEAQNKSPRALAEGTEKAAQKCWIIKAIRKKATFTWSLFFCAIIC